jgi:putative transposase
MNSVPISQRISSLADRLSQGNEAGELTSDLVRQATRLVVEQMLEAEVDERLGRPRYQRRVDAGDETSPSGHEAASGAGKGYRNGHKPRQLRTAEGKVPIELPQVRDAEGWSSALWQQIRQRTEVLDKLAVEMYARGLSTRDIEDMLGEIDDGDGQSLLSRSSVSRITEVLWEEFESFAQRDLSGFDVVYLFCDAVYESLRQQAGCKQAVLVTWGILADGSKVLIHLSLGNKESQGSWQEHFRSLIQRGLPNPLTVTSDGAPGAIAAIEATWPHAERIRCWFHKMKNVL